MGSAEVEGHQDHAGLGGLKMLKSLPKFSAEVTGYEAADGTGLYNGDTIRFDIGNVRGLVGTIFTPDNSIWWVVSHDAGAYYELEKVKNVLLLNNKFGTLGGGE
jgi:hypothetical protein